MPDSDALHDLGVRIGPEGGSVRVWSGTATSVELCVYDERDADWIVARVPLARDEHGVWTGTSPRLGVGSRYALRADGPRGPRDDFDPARALIDPYARGVSRSPTGEWRGYVQDGGFDWGASERPRTPLDRTVVYEAHVKGLTRLNPAVPEPLRGTYAGLAHPSTIEHLKHLGVTAVELLPVQQFVTERRLQKMGLTNYWGYNTLNFFTPHTAWASRGAQFGGTGAVLREFKGMVRLLHEAGLEVILDVVYNHTSEEGRDGPTTGLRGLDNANYYRSTADGRYIDTTGCGNTLDVSKPAAQRLVLDSLRYWADEVRVDGFRFDLMAALGRDADAVFDPGHPLLRAILDEPSLAGLKLIAEPWDVGLGGWQVGAFPEGYLEWNDGFRDRVRQFWLRDAADLRTSGRAHEGVGPLAGRVSGSSGVFTERRGPLASVNLVTAHDGFTAHDLTAYDHKHNRGNGEGNRDGSDDNRSWNFGVEGATRDRTVLAGRRKAVRNLLGALLFSGGVPMLTAGDEYGRSQQGNNNAYCHDSELTWLRWEHDRWERELLEVTRTLLRLRRENPALRPVRFARPDERTPSATLLEWYNRGGEPMTTEDWDSPSERTVQLVASSTPEVEEFNRVLLIVHGLEGEREVTLPRRDGVSRYTPLWDSGRDDGDATGDDRSPGSGYVVGPLSIHLLRAQGR